MAKEKTKTIDIEIVHEGFSFLRTFGLGKSDEFEELANLRSLLNKEKAKILHLIKTQKPESIYKLAKLLGRDFQSVRKDVLLMSKLGIIELEKKGKKRKSLKPVLPYGKLQVNIDL